MTDAELCVSLLCAEDEPLRLLLKCFPLDEQRKIFCTLMVSVFASGSKRLAPTSCTVDNLRLQIDEEVGQLRMRFDGTVKGVRSRSEKSQTLSSSIEEVELHYRGRKVVVYIAIYCPHRPPRAPRQPRWNEWKVLPLPVIRAGNRVALELPVPPPGGFPFMVEGRVGIDMKAEIVLEWKNGGKPLPEGFVGTVGRNIFVFHGQGKLRFEADRDRKGDPWWMVAETNNKNWVRDEFGNRYDLQVLFHLSVVETPCTIHSAPPNELRRKRSRCTSEDGDDAREDSPAAKSECRSVVGVPEAHDQGADRAPTVSPQMTEAAFLEPPSLKIESLPQTAFD